MIPYNYAIPKHLIPRLFLLKRHRYVRSILKNSFVLDLGCSAYKICSSAVSLDCKVNVAPDCVGSALKLPFPDGTFNGVTALELIEHFNPCDQHRFLEEVHRVLKPKGQFILSTPNISEATRAPHDFLWNISHFLYAREDLGSHIGELTHHQLKRLLRDHRFKLLSEKAFSFVNYVVECST